ncbi:recombination protein F [Pseudoalteromonas sp. THAF3]|uniref:retron Eco8 family effector endonuclease n=1 Tax=Pseudoalteromonas sp. THAF3 TaxID=2587843 RepID=UPI001268BCEA|nr:retron Eco8 family effector endonuclease [Pseudoalteromonas sp. THAF3]QFU05123.1 recombination protein F [Pseudoalteromonas sp. THAF3]
MGIKRIQIRNILSFKEADISGLEQVTCLLGKNNAGKSNLLKAISFFYKALEGVRCIPLELNSNYDSYGQISITFDTFHINKLVHSYKAQKNHYFSKVRSALFPREKNMWFSFFSTGERPKEYDELTLTLNIRNDSSYSFEGGSSTLRELILDIFPLFEIDSRHLELHDWNHLWQFLGKLRPFNAVEFQTQFESFLEESELETYRKKIDEINRLSSTIPYRYRDKIMAYLKAGLKGDKFEFNGFDLSRTSDGTNSYNYILTVLNLISALSKRTYQTPVIFVDEPEIGLHPKMSEKLIHEFQYRLEQLYTNKEGEKLKTSRPKLILSTHSQNIVKQVIKSFNNEHKVIHFYKKNTDFSTSVSYAKSKFDDSNFICNFGDNEARLFFSSFILFVEGQTEKEVFENNHLIRKFPWLLGVDVYKASDEKVSKKITPDFINTKIPYKFLFDADKGVKIHYDKSIGENILKFDRCGSSLDLRPIAIKKIKERAYMSYSLTKNDTPNLAREVYRLAGKIISLDKAPISICPLRLTCKKSDFLSDLFFSINRVLRGQNVIVLSTTIEGALINEKSLNLFLSWLRTKCDVDEIYKKINEVSFLNNSALTQYLRIAFSGKSDTLVKMKKFKRNDTPTTLVEDEAKKTMKSLEAILNSSGNTHKTSGWVSDFLNYAILELEHESKESKSEFEKLFRVYFKELYDTLSQLRYGSSEGESLL